jgi:hypothetical protein
VKIHRTSRVALVLIAVSVFVVGCSPGTGTEAEQGSAALDIECQAFYRSSVGQAPDDGTVLSLDGHGDSGAADYPDMAFDTRFNDDPGEGPALVISVTAKDSGDQILRQLYQIDRAKGLHNQFVGGHGFTGLVYAYHPTSGAELQFFCSAGSQ